MRRSPALAANAEPIRMLNTTPIIDVMLVLLVMLMLSLPSPTHKVAVDLPGKGGPSTPSVSHRLSIALDGSYRWDGNGVAKAELRQRLGVLAKEANAPALLIETDEGAAFERFDETMAIVKRAGIERFGFVGNPEAY